MNPRPAIGALARTITLSCHVVGCESGLPGKVVIVMQKPQRPATESAAALTDARTKGYRADLIERLEAMTRTYAICADCLARINEAAAMGQVDATPQGDA